MNQLLEEIYSTKLVKDAAGNSINPFPTATPYDIGVVLKEFIQKYNLERTLEVGMAYGLSTLFICQAHQDKGTGIHTAIDPMQNNLWKSIGLLNIERAGLADKLRFMESCSHEALPQLLTKGEKLDFAFIDGSHHFDYTLIDFFYIDKLLHLGGYVVF
ncbi:MAG: class I SAM-dependent methyltransferase [Scytonema sp. CRU_2_7]|nr:class I SAM-dependent methyltransferase [Scytonema sp. CRU_2_7]